MAAKLGRKPKLKRPRDQSQCEQLQAVVAAKHRPAQGCAQHLADHDGRSGLRDLRHVRWRLSDAHHGPHRANGTALHDVSFDRPLFRRTRLAGFLEPRFPRPPRMFEAAFRAFHARQGPQWEGKPAEYAVVGFPIIQSELKGC